MANVNNDMNRDIAIHCMEAECERQVCEECKMYGSVGTDHCQRDATEFAIEDMKRIQKAKQIIEKYGLKDISRDDVDNVVSGFEYEIIMAILGKETEL